MFGVARICQHQLSFFYCTLYNAIWKDAVTITSVEEGNYFIMFYPAFVCCLLQTSHRNKKALSKAEPKIFAPPQTPSRWRGTAKI